jgi:hypothetical protein
MPNQGINMPMYNVMSSCAVTEIAKSEFIQYCPKIASNFTTAAQSPQSLGYGLGIGLGSLHDSSNHQIHGVLHDFSFLPLKCVAIAKFCFYSYYGIFIHSIACGVLYLCTVWKWFKS